MDYARRTGIFPIMHLMGIRREMAKAEPRLAQSLCVAFTRAKDMAIADLSVVQALKISLPWMAQAYADTTDALGTDYWPYGVEKIGPPWRRWRAGIMRKACRRTR